MYYQDRPAWAPRVGAGQGSPGDGLVGLALGTSYWPGGHVWPEEYAMGGAAPSWSGTQPLGVWDPWADYWQHWYQRQRRHPAGRRFQQFSPMAVWSYDALRRWYQSMQAPPAPGLYWEMEPQLGPPPEPPPGLPPGFGGFNPFAPPEVPLPQAGGPWHPGSRWV
jgi:hypothetical protein